MPEIILYELGPTRSARVRWALLEADLPFHSRGNDISVFESEELRAIHPLGKLPAVTIDGRPLFESSAILNAIGDLAPSQQLIPKPNSWARYLHYQWMSFIQSEMEAFTQSTEVNSIDFIIPESEHVPDIKKQNAMFYRRAAAALDEHLSDKTYLINDAFSVADIYAVYTLHWGDEQALLDGFTHLMRYLNEHIQRAHCPLQPAT